MVQATYSPKLELDKRYEDYGYQVEKGELEKMRIRDTDFG